MHCILSCLIKEHHNEPNHSINRLTSAFYFPESVSLNLSSAQGLVLSPVLDRAVKIS